ncbi:MAG: hypothetical protein AB7T37_03655 [Dehalococcoidia bacterium]
MKSEPWIDIHAHVAGLSRSGVDADAYGVTQGVGTLVDAGGAPPAELAERLASVNSSARTRVLAWANICAEGIAGEGCANHDISGRDARMALTVGAGAVVGIKLQASNTRLAGRALEAIENAKAVAGDFGVPLLVHVGNAPPTIREVAARLRSGDIITHFAHGKPDGAVEGGMVHPSLRDARERGVLFDVGHGSGSFSFGVMEQLLADGFPPDIISTDLHAKSAVTPVGRLADCMSKLLGLGMPEEAVIAAVTETPRRALRIGLAHGFTEFALEEQAWEAVDSYGDRRVFRRRIIPEAIR